MEEIKHKMKMNNHVSHHPKNFSIPPSFAKRQTYYERNKFKEIIHSDNPWKATLEEDETEPQTLDDKIKEYRSLLNKLADQNFERILKKFIKIPINNLDELNNIIELFFQKAINEQLYSELYSKFASSLNKELKTTFDDPDPRKKGQITFKIQLLRKCRSLYEKSRSLFKQDSSDKNKEEKRKDRRNTLGNARFIGELYRQEMIKVYIIYQCLDELFDDIQDDSIETACQLLMTVGPKLLISEYQNSDKSKTNQNKFKKKKVVRNYEKRIKEMIKNESLTPRVRYRLMKEKPIEQENNSNQKIKEFIQHFREKNRDTPNFFKNILKQVSFQQIFCSICDFIFDSKESADYVSYYLDLIQDSKEIIKPNSKEAIIQETKNLKNIIINSPKAYEFFGDIIREMINDDFVEGTVIKEVLELFDKENSLRSKIPDFVDILLFYENYNENDDYNEDENQNENQNQNQNENENESPLIQFIPKKYLD
ncbi:eukaryotic translation initiation factor 4 gamma [Anaeramoeba ignava]|uniref:Eukaryotic translation initiation factor 4 gamma n=1 Tax=Anaeramoeba ignava TaxID=1746090 RepID=A0A9Q0R5S7_ANAIG|nr:eukaryotic translation initiation factor 4 gamma [Anaeramoeba ignava]